MPARKQAFVLLVFLLLWEVLDAYGRLDFLAGKLREAGPVGVFLAIALVSHGLRLALIVVGLILAARKETPRQEAAVPISNHQGSNRHRAGRDLPSVLVDVLTIAPREITKLYAQHTSYQADRLFQVYKEKRLYVSMTVRDVERNHDGSILVVGRDRDDTTLILEFPEHRSQSVNHVTRDDPLNAVGTIKSVAGQQGLALSDCERV